MRRLAFLVAVLGIGCSDELVAIEPGACGPWLDGGWDPALVPPGVVDREDAPTALARLPDGRLVVGGTFDHVGRVAARNVAAWDGRTWNALGAGLPGRVWSLAVDDRGVLWAAGGDGGRVYIASFDGQWETRREVQGTSAQLVTVDGGVIAFGAPGALRWDGDLWHEAAPPESMFVTAVARTPQGWCTAGRFSLVDEVRCWNGSAWSPLGTPTGIVTALARAPDGRWWAGAEGRLARLDDAGVWSTVDVLRDWDGFFPAPHVRAIAFEDDDIVIAGRFIGVGTPTIPAHGVARWRPSSGWSAVVPPAGLITRPVTTAMIADGARLHVAGNFIGIGDTSTVGVATLERDGRVTPWSPPDAIGGAGSISSLAPRRGGLLVAGGFSAPGVPHAHAAELDSEWTALPGLPSDENELSIAALSDGTPLVSGEFVWRWDGGAWQHLIEERTSKTPLVPDADGGVFFTRGHEDDVPGLEVVRWRSGETTPYGTIAGYVEDLELVDGRLYALAGLDEQHRAVLVHDEGTWLELPAPAAAPLRLASSPRLGVLAATRSGLFQYADDGWTQLTDAHVLQVAGCRDGVVLADAEVEAPVLRGALRFVDGVHAREIASGIEGSISALAVSESGLYLGVAGGGGSALVRFGN